MSTNKEDKLFLFIISLRHQRIHRKREQIGKIFQNIFNKARLNFLSGRHNNYFQR